MSKHRFQSLKKVFFLMIFLAFTPISSLYAQQVLKILASDTFIGTFNGALLGGGTMALANSTDLTPMRYGVGFGTLYGLGVGAIDLSNAKEDSPYRIHGALNNANYSTQIVLLDTFYGGATGTVIGMAISLIANKSIVKGLQYGSGAGVWAGFGFGLIDSFYLSQHGYGLNHHYSSALNRNRSGLIQIPTSRKSTLSFISPIAIQTVSRSAQNYQVKTHFGIQLAQLHISL